MDQIKKVGIIHEGKVLEFFSDSTTKACASSPIICDGRMCKVDERDIDFFRQKQIPQILAYANRRLFDTRIANNEAIGLDKEQIMLTDKMLRENSLSILRNPKCADISFEFEKQIDEIIAAIPEEFIQKNISPQYFNFAKKAEVA